MEQDAVTITANGARIFGACAALLILLLVGAGLAPLAKADATYSCAGLPFSLTGFPGTDSCIAGVGECRVTGTITLVASARRQLKVVFCVIMIMSGLFPTPSRMALRR